MRGIASTFRNAGLRSPVKNAGLRRGIIRWDARHLRILRFFVACPRMA